MSSVRHERPITQRPEFPTGETAHVRRGMKTTWIATALCGLLASWLEVVPCPAQGIPEPGLLMYGAITNTNGNIPFIGSGITWNVSAGTNSVTIPATVVGVNGQVFYVAKVPFETRSLPGGPNFAPTPNTLELTTTSTTYACSATLNGTNAALQSPSIFTFGPADRGRSTRLDLVVNLPRETFAQWSQRIFGQVVDPNADPLGKGMTYYQQYTAGTDPLDPNSVFKFINIRPAQSGLILRWSSVANHTYNVLTSSSPNGSYVPAATNLPATPPVNSFTDTNLLGKTNVFYRIQVN